MISTATSSQIDSLVADLAPVRRAKARTGLLVVAAATLLAFAVTAPIFGLRPDVAALHPSEIVLLRSGALLLMGVAAAWAVIASSSPGVGSRRDGWRWTVAAALLFPVTSLALVLGGTPFPTWIFSASSAAWCLGISLTSALAIGSALTAWLRRGAVTEPDRAGWLTGLAAGALGTFVYNLGCSSSSVHYAALWYGLAVVISAVVGRLVVPRNLRW
ncbi:NrsF family protein [Qipengyuania qiaonensis]|uniref:DUF1109 domain-containing protein n=1 Tax=Qipengyuania qiaonensis TaxID=2867240 RepID=A0ABS7J5A5_9SPHN|nr:DUF1109 domain-containing protein [Qipengyuania qiaonensis]MBX7481049.1 DUF1109 domain-containing protein [Qipengyuania qiaonensis]